MSSVRIGSRAIGVVFAGAVIYLLAYECHSGKGIAAQRETVGDASMTAQKSTSEVLPSPAGQANIRIVPRENENGQPPSLTFCYEESSAYDPQIRRIRMARVTGDRKVYEITAIGNAFLWREWPVGTVPRGFKLVEGDRLLAGVYEVYVDAVVGGGVLRVSIDNQGTIRRLPWDEFDKTYGKNCELSDRTAPRIVPKLRPGKDEVNKRRAKESRGR